MDSLVPDAWVVRLRWAMWLAVVAVAMASVVVLAGSVQWTLVGAVTLVGLGSNLPLALSERPSRPALVALLLLDTVLLTVFFTATGGANNPFTFLYTLPVVLCALVARPGMPWLVFVAAGLGYGVLLTLPGDPHAHHHGPDQMRAHVLGMFLAYGISGALLTFGVSRIRSASAEATARLSSAREVEQRTERLTALGTLAAGAAHELSSPLSTIAVASGELARSDNERVRSDAALIAAEVDRCRAILQSLAADAGAGMGEAPQRIALVDLVVETLEGWRWADRVEVAELHDAEREVVVPVALVTAALRRLLGNAVDAGPADASVVLSVELSDALTLSVRDTGPGMSDDVRMRASEPFFTTKPSGEGMGLGLYFARRVAEHLGGRLRLSSPAGGGTLAVLELPVTG